MDIDLVQWICMTVNVSLRYKFRFVSELASLVMQRFGLLVYASITDIILCSGFFYIITNSDSYKEAYSSQPMIFKKLHSV